MNPASSTGLERPCPVCGAREPQPHLVKGVLSLVRCGRCAMLYASPIDPALIDGEFYEHSGRAYYTSPAKLAGDFAPVRFRREVALFRRHCRAGRVLDVGCGTGAFLQQLRSGYPLDYTCLGQDVSGPALAHAAGLGLATTSVRFDAAEFRPGPLDAITFWAVLEHVAHPLEFLRKAAALLQPGGVCFVLVPNIRSLAVRLLGARYRYIMPEHVNAFTAHTLRRLVAAVPEFAIHELHSTHFNPVVIWQDLRHPREHVPETERAALLNQTNAWKSHRALGPLQFAYAIIERALGSCRLADNLVAVLRRNVKS